MIESTEAGIEKASELLREGKLVAFPTETVYGLGANALDEEACLSIFRAKGRPLTDPLIVHVPDLGSCARLMDTTDEVKEVFDLLAQRFWPGPLTMIVKASSLIPSKVTAGTGFVGIRCPAHPLAKRLLEVSQLPLAAPSANRFGHVSPTSAEHVLADLGEKDVYVLQGNDTVDPDNETCRHGIESTVAKIDVARKVVVLLRQGAVSEMDLMACLEDAGHTWSTEVLSKAVKMHGTSDGPAGRAVMESDESSSAGEVAPGQAITHYAPDVPCFLFCEGGEGSESSSPAEVEARTMNAQDAKDSLVVLDFGGQLAGMKEACCGYRELSVTGSAPEAARDLFAALRWSELVPGAELVLVASVQGALDQRLGAGVADRIMRATSGKKLDFKITSSS